tara:strand:+ start:2762 stop:3754 length:993 start_codon:yes stop_codon:yes gene_type:complete
MKMKTLRGEGTTNEWFGAQSMRAARISGIDKDHTVNRSRLVKSLIRKAAFISHYRESKQRGLHGKTHTVLNDEEYLEAIKAQMLDESRWLKTSTGTRKTMTQFIEQVVELRTSYNRMVSENGQGTYTVFSRRQTVYADEDSAIGIHFRPTVPNGVMLEGKGIPRSKYNSQRLVDEDMNNDDWDQLLPMMQEMLSGARITNDVTSRKHLRNALESRVKQLALQKKEFDEIDWEAEQEKDDEIQAWLDSVPSHARSHNLDFRSVRGFMESEVRKERALRDIEWTKNRVTNTESEVAKNAYLDHLNLESLQASEWNQWTQIVNVIFGIGGEEE